MTLIKGPVIHTCGWESDTGAFPEGAGCPKCSEPISVDSVRLPELPSPSELSLSEVREQQRAEMVPAVKAPVINREALLLANLTVPEAVAHISGIKTILELQAFLDAERAEHCREEILDAIDARDDELVFADRVRDDADIARRESLPTADSRDPDAAGDTKSGSGGSSS